MRVVESLLGFKDKKTPILQQRNSILKLLFIINIPNLILLFVVNKVIPDIYMDEEFHYRQFSFYQQNQFQSWDPKLTTPPGLYLLQRLTTIILPPDLAVMRALNCLLFSNIFVVYALKVYDFMEICPNNLSRALNLALTPTIFFFNFLDYTDAASISLVAVMFYYNLTKSEWRLGFVSLLAVFVRQNNLIWIIYLIIYRVLSDHKKQILIPKSLPSHFITILKIFFTNKWQILRQCRFQIIVVAAFLGFIKIYNNGQLVFGDHTHHRLTFHPNQLLYLSLFILCNIPITIGEYINSINNFFQRIYISRHSLASYLFVLSMSIILVDKYTLVHPFITDDNRHYTFYIYRYIMKHSFFRFGLCLVYAFAFHFIFKQIVNSELKLMRFILWLGASFGYLCFS
jgi:alpha-1,2-glucosyltransferase